MSTSGPAAVSTLLAVAAPAEARAVIRAFGVPEAACEQPWTLIPLVSGLEMVVTGVGKAAAAGGVARTLDPCRHRLTLSLGIAGSLPNPDKSISIRSVVVATVCHLADDGVLTDSGFETMASLGFPPGSGLSAAIPVQAEVLGLLGHLGEALGPVATVSTCSGTDAAAHQVAARTGAIAEAMEGAAVAATAHRLGVWFGEIRVVSNTTGSRSGQVWDLCGALERLSDVAGRLPGALALRAEPAGEA